MAIHFRSRFCRSRCFDELLELDDESRELVESLVPRFRIVLDDISQVDDWALLARPMTPLARVVLFLFRHARTRQGIFARLDRVAGPLVEVAQHRNGGAAIAAILVYLQKVTRQDEAQVGMAIQQALGESAYEQILKAGERLEAKGLQRGIEQGLQRGIEQGLQRQRSMLLRQLGLRFGELPAWAQDRVNAADAEALDAIAERVVGASTLAEALGDLAKNRRRKTAQGAPRRRGRTS